MKHLQKPSSTKSLVILTGVFLSAYLFLNAFQHPLSILTIKELSGGHTILNVLPYYDAKIAYAHLLSYSPEAISIYKRILLFDGLILIPVYVIFFAKALVYFAGRLLPGRKQLVKYLPIIPLFAGILNYLEDAIVFYLLATVPEKLETLATLGGFITTSKTLLISISMITILGMFLVHSGVALLKSIKPALPHSSHDRIKST